MAARPLRWRNGGRALGGVATVADTLSSLTRDRAALEKNLAAAGAVAAAGGPFGELAAQRATWMQTPRSGTTKRPIRPSDTDCTS